MTQAGSEPDRAHAPRVDRGGQPYEDITEVQATSLLRMGLPGPRKAADDLVDQLEATDSGRWLDSLLRRSPFDELSNAHIALLAGPADVSALNALKDRGKDIVKNPPTREAYLAGLAAYYAAIAAALVQHNQFITRQPRAELESVLQELASVAPGAWAELFTKAAMKLSKQP
ncbi:MAG: hypothetical protein JSR77_03955 [Planctomycetes bacterium]|nr:hypothetical protein [Planctomycetota bacterium]